VHAVDAMIRTLNRGPGGPVTSAAIDAVVTTGDAIDNAQWNETEMFLALFDGGRVRLTSGETAYEGVQSRHWPGRAFWRPDGGDDIWREQLGFPTYPGLLERAMAEFNAPGLMLPWLACYGNHEALAQGVGAMTDALREFLVGGVKPTALPQQLATTAQFRPDEMFMSAPERFTTGPHRAIRPDADRRHIGRHEFVEAHFRDGGLPFGHGFSVENRREGTAYYSYDLPTTRLIALDTNYVIGGADGSVDSDQLCWLEERLVEVHSTYLAADGSIVQTGNEDRLVAVFSHHGSDTLTSRHAIDPSDGHGAPALLRLLHRFGNVVLWLNGHTHTNAIRAQPNPRHSGAGLWEVTTCAIVDWPCQARIVELVDNGDGTLSIACTMLDHDSRIDPGGGGDLDLASLHRELAGNVPWSGFDSGTSGAAHDRNVELRLRAPFPLERLKSG
jgi:metallophosphoesterase (TIGR03767 family)